MADNDGPAIISDHKFVPRGEWYTLCRICGLARAAHVEAETEPVLPPYAHYYSDDNPEEE